MKFVEWWQTYKDNIPPELADGFRAACCFAWCAAVASERDRCARIAIERAEFHAANCRQECRCADGYHIAAFIRGVAVATDEQQQPRPAPDARA